MFISVKQKVADLCLAYRNEVGITMFNSVEEQGMCLESKLKAKVSKPQIQQSFHFPFGNQEETKKCHHPVKVLWT